MDSVSHDAFDFTTSETGDTATASVNTVSKTFTITLTPVSGDAFDFKAMEESEAAGQLGRPKYELIDVDDRWMLSGGDNIDDLATYQPDTAIIGPGKSYTYTLDPREVGVAPGEPFTFTLDPREVDATLVEYAVML